MIYVIQKFIQALVGEICRRANWLSRREVLWGENNIQLNND